MSCLLSNRRRGNAGWIWVLLVCFGLMPILAQAQQDRFKARVGVGVGNQFNNQGRIVGTDSEKEGNLSLKGQYLSYSAYFENLLSPDWGLAIFTTTTPGARALRNTGLVFNYYTDNDYFFSKQAFVAPYFKAGVALDSRVDEFNIPFGGGLKWRLGHRVNLNVDLTARTYPKHWSEKDANGLSAYSSLSLFFNFGAKPRAYRAPKIYASAEKMITVPPTPVVPEPKEEAETPVHTVKTDTVSNNSMRTQTARSDTVRTDTLRLADFEPVVAKPDSLEGDFKTISQVGDTLVADSLYVQDTTGGPNPYQGLFARARDSLLKVEVDLEPKVFFEDTLYQKPDTSIVTTGFSAVPLPADSLEKKQDLAPRDTVVRITGNKYEPSIAAPAQNFKKDSLNLYLSFENQRLREKLATNDKIQSLEERIRSLESRPVTSSSQPAPAPAARSTNSTTEVRIVHEDDNNDRTGTALTGAAVGAAAANGRDDKTREELQKLQRKVDSLQWQLAQDRKLAIPAPVVVNAPPARVDTVVSRSDTAQTARIQKLQNQLSESASETARLNARLSALTARLDSARAKHAAPEPKPEKVVIPKAEVFFDNNSSALNAQGIANLRVVQEAAEKNPAVKFEIRGFTDKSGSVAYNQALSKKRAEAVRDHLLMKGISSDRLTIRSMGPDESLQEKRSLYGRRVEVVPVAD